MFLSVSVLLNKKERTSKHTEMSVECEGFLVLFWFHFDLNLSQYRQINARCWKRHRILTSDADTATAVVCAVIQWILWMISILFVFKPSCILERVVDHLWWWLDPIGLDLIWFDWRQSIALFWLVEQWIWYSEETGTLLGNFRRKVGKSVKNAEISAIVLHLYRKNSYEKVWKFKIEER